MKTTPQVFHSYYLFPLFILSQTAFAELPEGWVDQNIVSAYTFDARSFDISGSVLAVNSDIDFLGVRDDLVASNPRLSGNTGDLSGNRLSLSVGLHRRLTAFYSQQTQDMTINLDPGNRVVLQDLDNELRTSSREYGLKWNFYESRDTEKSGPWRAASLEISRVESDTKDFAATIEKISITDSFQLSFNPPQQFQLDQMEDEGWRARVIYSWPLAEKIATSIWGGYTQMDASSGTSSDIQDALINEAFEQRFEVDESHYLAGASVNWQLTPKLPIQLSYEYIRLNSRSINITRNASSNLLPSFLQGDNLASTNHNHTIKGSITYWITPHLHIGINGNLFTNQFIGVMPHYNNPLSGSFAEHPYGYLGIKVGYKL